MGTDCQNQPEVHELLQAFRAADPASPRPAVILKAEAIVSPATARPLPRRGTTIRPECNLAYHNQLMVHVLVDAGLARRTAGRGRAAPRRLPRPRRRPGSPTSAATTTSAGRSPTRTPRRWASTAPATAASWPTSTTGASPAPSPAARCSSTTRRPATAASSGMPPRCAASRRRWRPRTPARSRRHPPLIHGAVRLRLRRPAAHLHGRRDRPAQRPPGPTTRRTRMTTAGCTARRWTGPRPTGGMILTASRAGYSPRSGPWLLPGAQCWRCARVAAPRSCEEKTAACWPTGGLIRAARRSWP